MTTKVPIDIGVLCDLMDNLCASMIVTIRLRSGTLHDVTMPKSWLLRVIPKCEALRSKDTRLSTLYKMHLRELLERIYTGDNACTPTIRFLSTCV